MADGTCAHCAGPTTRKFCSQDCYHLSQRTSDRVEMTCACGKTFETRATRVASGRGRYCSKACMYANRTRPSGLTYEIKDVNQGWLQPGHEPWNKGKATGVTPWNKGMKGIRLSPETEFKPGHTPTNWKGDEVGYFALHAWLRRAYGDPEACEQCGVAELVQWANRTGLYLREREDWLHLCPKCHRRYDIENGLVGIVAERFS